MRHFNIKYSKINIIMPEFGLLEMEKVIIVKWLVSN